MLCVFFISAWERNNQTWQATLLTYQCAANQDYQWVVWQSRDILFLLCEGNLKNPFGTSILQYPPPQFPSEYNASHFPGKEMRIPIRPINKHFEQYLLAAAQPKPTNTTGWMKTPGLLPEQHYPYHIENASQNISLFPPFLSPTQYLLVQKYTAAVFFRKYFATGTSYPRK